MKLDEILTPQRIDEITLKQVATAAMISTAAISLPMVDKDTQPVVQKQQISDKTILSDNISSKYKIKKSLAREIVDLAYKHADPKFPTAKDLLAIVGVESSFNPTAKSNLKRDPAIGLTQIRPGIWKINPQQLLASKDEQIKNTVKILRKYYKKLNNKEAAIQAYNIGITSFRKGKRNFRYLSKFKKEVTRYRQLI